MLAHMAWLVEPAIIGGYDDALVELAHDQGGDGNVNRARLFPLGELDAALEFAVARNSCGCNVYIGATLRRPTAQRAKHAVAEDFYVATAVPIDVDESAEDANERIQAIASPGLVVTTGTLPRPRQQLWARLAEPCADGETFQKVFDALVAHVGGDRGATGLNRLMRLGGSISYPKEAKRLKGYVVELTTLRLDPDATPVSIEVLSDLVSKKEAAPAGDKTKEEATGKVEFGDSFWRNVNSLAIANLDAWVPIAFPSAERRADKEDGWRVSSDDLCRGNEEDLSFHPTGIKDFGVHDLDDPRKGKRTPIDVLLEHWEFVGDVDDSCSPKDAAFWLCERLGLRPVDLGWRGDDIDAEVHFDELDESQTETKQRQNDSVEVGGAQLEVAPSDPLDAIELGRDVDWTRPGGLLGEMTEWILATARYPNRPLAAAAATAVLSVACGQHLYSATSTAMNLYVACLAGTAVGKDRPLSAISEILRAANLERFHASGKVFTASGLDDLIVANPCCVATIDELGTALLNRISNKHASANEQAIKSVLQELWSRFLGKASYWTTRRARVGATEVRSPSLTLYGVATPETFYGALTAANVADGFMNRFLVVEAAPRPPKANEGATSPVPQSVIERLRGIVPTCLRLGAAFGAPALSNERRLEWASPEVKAAADALEEELLTIIDRKVTGYQLLGRAFETSVRLAGLHAVSRGGPAASVDICDLQWGAGWAIQSARSMMAAAATLMARNEYETTVNQVETTIREAGTIKHSDLLRKCRNVRARDMTEIVASLSDQGVVQKIAQKSNAGSGRNSTVYRWSG